MNRGETVLPAIFRILLAVALLLLAVTFVLLSRVKKAERDSCLGEGYIVGFRHGSSEIMLDDYETTSISPVVRYTAGGQVYEFVGNYYATTMKIGDKVEVLYNRQDMSKARLNRGRYLAPIVTGAIACVFIVLYVAYLFTKKLI